MGYGIVGGTCDQNRAYQHFGNPAAANSGTPANWIFADGHAKALKWKQTILPLDRNMWELNPARNTGDMTVKADDGNFTFPGANWNDNNAICPRLR
jgi:prepilin-type processing-associated H-X9-DG protein